MQTVTEQQLAMKVLTDLVERLRAENEILIERTKAAEHNLTEALSIIEDIRIRLRHLTNFAAGAPEK